MPRALASILIGTALAFAVAMPATAERLAVALSSRTVSVDSSFAGETLTLFGNIEPEFGSDRLRENDGYDVVVVIRGPASDRVARRKTRTLGVWLNTEQILYESLPSYFWVLSSSRLSSIAEEAVLSELELLPETQLANATSQGNGDTEELGVQLLRLMRDAELYGLRETGVIFRSRTLFSATMPLPASVPNGDFLSHIYLFHDGKMVAERAVGFSVRKTGFERLLGSSAKSLPLVYGLVCAVLAVFTGWLGGVIFRR